jgi:hypothetical protein
MKSSCTRDAIQNAAANFAQATCETVRRGSKRGRARSEHGVRTIAKNESLGADSRVLRRDAPFDVPAAALFAKKIFAH